jgi:hypothetical protein
LRSSLARRLDQDVDGTGGGRELTPGLVIGYLLTKSADGDKRTRANGIWKQHIQALSGLGKGEMPGNASVWITPVRVGAG